MSGSLTLMLLKSSWRTNLPHIEALRNRLGELREIKEKARILHDALFRAHLIDEQMISHKLMADIELRIEQLEMLLSRHERKARDE